MENSKIYQNIISAMNDIDSIGKNSTNKIQNFKYRGIDDVMNTLKPILAKNNIFIVPEYELLSREEKTTAKGGTLIYTILKGNFTFFSNDSSFIKCTTIGEAMDSGDKSVNKAMSVALKYALFQVFCIPTEDDPDKDSYTLSSKKNTKKEQNVFIDVDELKQITELLEVKNIDLEDFLKEIKLNKITNLPKNKFKSCMEYISKK